MARELIELGRAKSCPRGKIWRKGYTRKGGTRVKGACVEDTGKPGKTPKSKRVLPSPKEDALKCGRKDWSHDKSKSERMNILECLVKKRQKPCRTVIRNLNLLANYTKKTSPETHRKARADMKSLHEESWCKLKTKK